MLKWNELKDTRNIRMIFLPNVEHRSNRFPMTCSEHHFYTTIASNQRQAHHGDLIRWQRKQPPTSPLHLLQY